MTEELKYLSGFTEEEWDKFNQLAVRITNVVRVLLESSIQTVDECFTAVELDPHDYTKLVISVFEGEVALLDTPLNFEIEKKNSSVA